MIRSFEHPNYVTISTKTYAVDTQKYRLDETVLLSTQNQMLSLVHMHNIHPGANIHPGCKFAPGVYFGADLI